jgi:hypothetical protein
MCVLALIGYFIEISINLKGKKTKKNVPDWVLRLVALNKVKDI